MSNQIVLSGSFQESCPELFQKLKGIQNLFDSISSFADIERLFLMGHGLSKETYSSYKTAVKQFYDFTGGRHPLQIIPADIEKYFIHVRSKNKRNTAVLRIAGLKKFYSNVEKQIPLYKSPFAKMDKRLLKKLSKKQQCKTKKALSKTESIDILSYLSSDTSLKGVQKHAIVLFLLTTGLRSKEVLQLTWDDVTLDDGKYYATFEAKGGDIQNQEIPKDTYNVVLTAFIKQYNRKPKGTEAIFNHIRSLRYPGMIPIKKQGLWELLKRLGKELKDAGIIRSDIAFSAHLFRRTFATLLIKAGMDLKSVQLQTRHKSIEVLAKHYIDSRESVAPYFNKILSEVA